MPCRGGIPSTRSPRLPAVQLARLPLARAGTRGAPEVCSPTLVALGGRTPLSEMWYMMFPCPKASSQLNP